MMADQFTKWPEVISLEQTAGFHPGFFNGEGPATLASQILYLITTLGKSLTIPFPGVAKARGPVGETRIQ